MSAGIMGWREAVFGMEAEPLRFFSLRSWRFRGETSSEAMRSRGLYAFFQGGDFEKV